ncbi:MAG TPA: hypothetical protein DCL44_07335 [Elusimicrobia bacterium]|nr:hypothetical protein [Elusimicrobiota bacterium]
MPLYSGASEGQAGISLNYPGLGIRYLFSDRFSLELKGQSETDILAAGLRGYYYFSRSHNCFLFTGLEGDYISFSGRQSSGAGFAAGVFAGLEYFLAKSLSLQADFGPAYIALSDKNGPESVSGLEYVVNFGLNYYF